MPYLRSYVKYVARNGMTVSGYMFSCTVPGPQWEECVCLRVQIYSTWPETRRVKCTWFASHIYQNTLDSEWL